MTIQNGPLPFIRSLELKVKMTDVRGKSPDDCIRRAVDIATRQGMTVVGVVDVTDLRQDDLRRPGEVELRHLNVWITQAIYVAEQQRAASPEGKVAWMLVAQLEQRIAQVADDLLEVQLGQLGCVQALIAAGEPQQARSYVSTLNLDVETLQRAEEMLLATDATDATDACAAHDATASMQVARRRLGL